MKIVRIFSTYGPKMDINDGRVVSNFIVQALRGEQIIYGNGEQTRSFQYRRPDRGRSPRDDRPRADDFTGPVGIGNPNELRSRARIVLELTGSNRKSSACPCRRTTRKQRKPDITLAHKMLATGN